MDEQILAGIIEHDFFMRFRNTNSSVSWPIAHLWTVTHETYLSAGIPIIRTSEGLKTYTKQKELYNILPDENPALFQFIFRIDPLMLTGTAANENNEGTQTDIIETFIIEEDQIVYMNISSFQFDVSGYIDQLNDFYENIQHYEHLIIDIRECRGGRSTWLNYIMNPLWRDRNNMPDMPLFVFINEETLIHHSWNDIKNRLTLMPNYVATTELIPVDEILKDHPLLLRNEDDFKRLTHGFVLNTSFENIADSSVPVPKNIPFNGQIWLLTSEKNYSSSAIFAHHAKYMEFATLVGETVGGGITSPQNITFNLPNSGLNVSWEVDYITDINGRSLTEFPTTPHYENNPGMNALETVLIMIRA